MDFKTLFEGHWHTAFYDWRDRLRGLGRKGYRTIHRLNRSQHWKPASSYQHARDISPFPLRPVR